MRDQSKSLTQYELSSLVNECRSLIKGRRIVEFRDLAPEPGPGLPARSGEKFIALLEDADSTMQRIVRLVVSVASDLNYMLVSPRPQRRLKKGEGSWFAQGLHAMIAGSRITAINVEERDRIVTLVIENRDRLGYSIKFELFGRRANILLIDEEGTIVRALRESRTETRHIAEGIPYPPPVRPSARRKTIEPSIRFDSKDPSALQGLALNEAADGFFHDLELHARLERTRNTLLSQSRTATKRTRRAIDETENKIARARGAEKIKEEGDLLKAHFHLLARGMDKIEVTNIFSTERKSLTIALDPKLDPSQNLEAIYKRYRKMSRSGPHLETMLLKYEKRRDKLERLEKNLEQAVDLEEIEPLFDEMAAEGLIKGFAGGSQSSQARDQSKSARGAKVKPGNSKNIRRFFITRNQEALVGKDGETNHRLLHQARGGDIWLHCHNTAGAHVVVPMAKNQNPSIESLLSAGQLALHFSQLRGAEQADVIYTERKYVRAIKGGKKGQVTVERFKTLRIRRDPALLQKILDRTGE